MDNAICIERTRIIGTDTVVFSAWEPSRGTISPNAFSHSSISTLGGDSFWGQIGSRHLPIQLSTLPATSPERSAAVRAYHAGEYQRAYALIRAEYPDIPADSREDMGEIIATIPRRTPPVPPVRIGDDIPGYHSSTVRPVVRVESWAPYGIRMEPIDLDSIYLGTVDDSGKETRVYPDWSVNPEWVVISPGARAMHHVRAVVTGRTVSRWGAARWIRGRLDIAKCDGEQTVSLACWFLVD